MAEPALVVLAVAAGLIFRVFQNDQVIYAVAYAIPIYMLAVAAEIVLNFILQLYRPRVPGEIPRPAFDSRILSLLAAPDSIVRSINEAVNYQFGFDITSSWGYQLLLRSFVWLVALGVGVMVLLNTMVVVEPHQQAVRVRMGEIVGEVRGSGIMWKWPWPIETARFEDVRRIRELSLTARRLRPGHPDEVQWIAQELRTDRPFDPFIVGGALLPFDEDVDEEVAEFVAELVDEIIEDAERAAMQGEDEIAFFERDEPVRDAASVAVSQVFALIDAEIVLQYRIRSDADGRGLLEYLNFAPGTLMRRHGLTVQERALQHLALRSVSQHLASMTLDEVMTVRRGGLDDELRERIQASFDRHMTGVEVVAVTIPTMRPSGKAAMKFEDLAVDRQNRLQRNALARRDLLTGLTVLVGDAETARSVLDDLDELDRLRTEHGRTSSEAMELQAQVERTLVQAGGQAGQVITRAERDRWIELMSRRAQASRTRSQALAFRAAPELYKERETMRILMQTLAPVRKYVIGIGPDRVNVDVDVKELSPVFDAGIGIDRTGEGGR
jgi:modulator of FtsH protease HflK